MKISILYSILTLGILSSSVANNAPVFTVDPIAGSDATEDAAYVASITGSATDDDGDSLTYAKVSGPAWLSVAANGDLTGTPANSDVGANAFTVSVTDGIIATPVEATLNITVLNANDAPVFTVDPIAGSDATEDAAYVASITGSATDDDGDSLTYAKVSGPAWLSVAANGDLTGTPANSDVGANAFTVSVTDGIIATPVEATLNITVLNANDAPVFTVDPIAGSDATEDAAYVASITGSATDDDGDSLTYAKVSGPAWLSVAANGDLTGTPANSDVGANAFTVSVTDGIIATPVEATLNITVLNANDAPVFTVDPIAGSDATEDAAYVASITGSATDDDGDSLTYAKVSGPAWLSVAANGDLTGTPANSDVGANAFTVSVTDGIIATPVEATLNITVLNANDAPVFTVDPIAGSDATEDAAYVASITGSATDDDGDTLTYAKVSGPAWLSVAANGDLTGTPANSDVGANAFTVSVTDGIIATPVEATLNITVLNANDAPVFTVDPIAGSDATEDAAYVASITGSATDDDGDSLTYAKVSGPAWLSVAANGDLTGTPANSDVGANAFTVSVTDGIIATPVEATLNITVLNANDAPVFTVDPIAGSDATEDAAYVASITGSATDDDGDSLTYAKVSGPAWLSVAANGDLTGTPANSDVGANAFTVSVTDGIIATPVEATLNITVLNANDAPVFTVDPIAGSDATEDAAYVASITGSATDDDGDSLTYAKVSGPAWLSVAANGDLTGTPANSDVGANAFTVSVTDGIIATPVEATLNITVLNANDAPVFTVDPIAGSDATEDAAYVASITGSATDDDGDSLTYAKVSGPAWLSVAANGDLTGTPANSDVGANAFTVSVTDGIIATPVEATLNITVLNANDAPVFTVDPIAGSDATEDAAYVASITGSATDDDGDSLTYAKVSGPAWLSVAANGDLTGTPANSDVGANAFTVSVTDGIIATPVEATLNITVLNANDAPVFTVDPIAGSDATEDAAYVASITGSATDDDGDSLTYAKVSGPAWLSVAANGDLTGTPANSDVGANAFTVSVTDGIIATPVEATLNITVLNANDAPVFTVDPIAGSDATEDAAYVASITGSATDDDGDSLTYAKVSGPAWLSVAANGDLTGTPANSDVGANAFTVSVTDGIIATPVEATLNITVLNANDAPVFTVDPIAGSDATEDAAYVASITGSATDDDGDSLTYAKVSGPAWLSVAANGDLTGTPANSDVGANAFTVSVTDGIIATPVEATLNITVLNANDAPVFTVDPIAGSDATEDAAYVASITGSATDDDGDSLTYAKVSGPAWLSVAANGDLTGTPANSDVGANAFTVSVTDGIIATPVEATLNITVLNANDAPVFTVDPIAGSDATEDAAYVASITGSATDDDGDSLTYAKVSGPAWLSVAANGDLTGTPANSDVGANAFTVSVTDGIIATPVEATLNITVAPSGLIGYYPFDGDFNDASGNGNHLTIGNGLPAITTTAGESAFGGGALDTDGAGERLDLTSPITFSGTDTWSVSFWARLRNAGTTYEAMVVGDLSSESFIWVPDASDQVRGLRLRSKSNVTADYGSFANDQEFHHWVVVADGSGNVTVYRDNVNLGTQTSATDLDITSVAQAHNNDAIFSMNGQIDELYIYDQALDSTRVNELYNDAVGLPTLLTGIADDRAGGPVEPGSLVTYTVTFSKDMDDATVAADDFGNAGSIVSYTIGTVSETAPGVFSVPVTPNEEGTLQLQINQSAVLSDTAGNDLDTSAVLLDDTIITVETDEIFPTLVELTDDAVDGAAIVGGGLIYTLTFSEDMDAATVEETDFGNAGSATFAVGAISETAPGVFKVLIIPSSTGTIQLQINQSAVLSDLAGNGLDTTTAIVDDQTITVAPSLGEPGLIGYYPFDGDFNDASGNGNHLTIGNGSPAITTTAGESAFGGGALDTDGAGERLDLTSPITFSGTDTWSVSFWARLRNAGTTYEAMVVGDLSSESFIWVPDASDQVRGLRLRSKSNVTADYGSFANDQEFHHWVVVADGSGNVTVYRDNVNLGTQTSATDLDITSVAQAHNNDAIFSMNGQIDELYIYDQALDSTRVNELYNDAIGPDVTVPTLTGIADDRAGGPVEPGSLVTYTVTFSEDMDDATVAADDFGNAGSIVSYTIGTVTETSPGVFSVPVTPDTTGTLQLQINQSAVLSDTAGNDLDTSAVLLDDTIITVEPGAGTTYATWSGGAAAGDDTNGDGVENAVAYALGAADVSESAIGLLPTLGGDATYIIFSYNRSDDANDDGTTAIEVEYGSDLSGWTVAVDGVGGVVITETGGSPTDAVVVQIPKALAVGGKLFARLRVVVTP